MTGGASVIGARLHHLRLDTHQPLEWTAGGHSAFVDYLLLQIDTTDTGPDTGANKDITTGTAEIICRPEWNGLTPAVLASAFAEMVWPQISRLRAPSRAELARLARNRCAAIREMSGLKALIDNAFHDLCWRAPEGTAPATGLRRAQVLTRNQMEAASRGEIAPWGAGVSALKLKFGGGLDLDEAAALQLRAAHGPALVIGADANSSYRASDLARLGQIAARAGISFYEDPLPLAPSARLFGDLEQLGVPVVVDKPMSDPAHLAAYLELGARDFALKPARLGMQLCLDLAAQIAGAGGRICLGTYSESDLGTLAQWRFAGACAAAHGSASLWPVETCFYRELRHGILRAEMGPARDGLAWPPAPLGQGLDGARLAAATRAAWTFRREQE